MTGKIVKVSGPLIVAENLADVEMYDVVKVSEQKLIGEVIELRNDRASIQVYEETSGLKVGDPVESTGAPLSVELGPGLIESIFDGIQRPLNVLAEKSGNRIERGVEVNSLDREKAWHFVPAVKKGESVGAGDVLGTVQETNVVLHKIMVPVGVEGKVSFIAAEGAYTVTEKIAEVNGKDVCMMQKWPVRRGRPYKSKMAPDLPMVTGQRVIDTLFPIAKGGVAAVPGPFGSGKTVVQHQLAKWADADIIVYVGCGERGNEMTDVLQEFPHLNDPKTGQPLMKRTVLIANTSDMPLDTKIYENIREKSGIGKLAASMICDGDTVMLDSGTTTLEIAKNLKWFNRLTIVTNAINIALEIQKYNRFNTILLGGHIRNTSLSVVGPVAEQNVRSFYCDKLFLGVDSFSMTDGISTPNIEEANLNRTMMSMAREVIAVFDHTKCYKRNFAHICMPNELDAIVSDRKFPGKLKAELQEMGVEVHIANLEE